MDQQHISGTIDVSSPQRPFPFFDLPRELRDLIYGHVHHDHKDVAGHELGEDEPKISLKCGPTASALLICRQFSYEYRDVMEKQATMLFYDHPRFHPLDYSSREDGKGLRHALHTLRTLLSRSMRSLRHVRFAEFVLTGEFFGRYGDNEDDDLDDPYIYNYAQAEWVEDATQALIGLETFEIKYLLTGWERLRRIRKWSDKVKLLISLILIQEFTEISKVSRIELFAASGDSRCMDQDAVDEHELNDETSIAVWTPQSLWQMKADMSACEVKSCSCGNKLCLTCVKETRSIGGYLRFGKAIDGG